MLKKVLFYVGFAIVTFVITLAILSQRLDTNYNIERDVLIKAPIHQVYAEIGDLKKWQEWSPWKKRDPSMEQTFSTSTTTVGGSTSWKSSKQGNGTMTITEVGVPSVFAYTTKFDGWSGTPEGDFHLINMAEGVKVVWAMHGTRGFIDKIFWTFFKCEEMIRKDFDEGLANLKSVVEAQPVMAEPAPAPVKEQPKSAKTKKSKKKKKK